MVAGSGADWWDMKKLALALLLVSGQPLLAEPGVPVELAFPEGSAAISGHSQGVAMSDGHVLVGSPQAHSGAGEVHVFSATTGKHLRRLKVPGTNQMGARVALSGGRAFVQSGVSKLHAFEVATGKLLWSRELTEVINSPDNPVQIKSISIDSLAADGDAVIIGMMSAWWGEDPNFNLYKGQGAVTGFHAATGTVLPVRLAGDGQENSSLGYSVAVAGEMRLAGEALRDVGNQQDCGRALLYVPNSNLAPSILNHPTPAAGDRFGAAVAVAGSHYLISAPLADYGGKTNLGRVYVYDRRNSVLVNTLEAPAFYASDAKYGLVMASCGSWVVIGGSGHAQLYDTATGNAFRLLSGQTPTSSYGSVVAVCSHAAVVADSQATGGKSAMGRVFLFQRLSRALPWEIVAETTQAAPGTEPGVLFSSFGETTVSAMGKVMHTAKLKAGVSSSANNTGVWNNLSGSHDLLVRKGETVGGLKVGTLSLPFFSPSGNLSFVVARPSSTGKQHLLLDNGMSLVRLFGEGESVVVDGNTETLGKLSEVVSSGHAGSLVTASFSARTGVNGVSSKTDSRIGRRGLFSFNADAREGDLSPVTDYQFGQIGPRVSAFGDHVCFTASLVGPATGKGGLFTKNLTSSVVSAPATYGAFASGAGLAKFSSITSFQMHKLQVVYKATIKGGAKGVTSGLWRNTALVALKGSQAPGYQAGVKYERFLDYFNAGDDMIVYRARVSGPGVNASNDVGIWVHRPFLAQLLLQEGGYIPNTFGQRVGVIQRLDVDTDGRYAILVSIAGAEAARNQALLVGRLTSTELAFAGPSVLLHKGTGVDGTGLPPLPLQSLTVFGNHIDATGAGSKGAAGQVRGERVAVGLRLGHQTQLRAAAF